MMNNRVEFANFELFLSTYLKDPKQYSRYLKRVMKIENIQSLEDLASNIVFYQYKYKHCAIEGIKEKTKKNYLTALNSFYEFLYPSEERLTFKINIKKELSLEEYKDIKLKISKIENTQQIKFDNNEYIKIKTISKGSMVFLIAVCSVLKFSFKVIKAVKLIRKLKNLEEHFNKEEVAQGVLLCASIILDIADILLPDSGSLIISFGKTVIELTGEIISLIKDKLK